MKDEIRKQLIKKRNDLSKTEIIQKSRLIKNKLFKLKEFIQSNTILFYISYDNEAFTHEMIKESILNKKNVIVPISDKKNKKLILSKLKNWEDLSIGSYGIFEPKKEKVDNISIKEIDMIIVPGIGFDKSGNRMGHGKGYYDKLLENFKGIAIALAFDFQVIDKIPIEPHDKKVNIIVTEKKMIYC